MLVVKNICVKINHKYYIYWCEKYNIEIETAYSGERVRRCTVFSLLPKIKTLRKQRQARLVFVFSPVHNYGGLYMKVLINQIRLHKNITLSRLAAMSGVSKSTLNDLENEKRSPRLEQLECIAAAMRVSINDLFESEYQF